MTQDAAIGLREENSIEEIHPACVPEWETEVLLTLEKILEQGTQGS